MNYILDTHCFLLAIMDSKKLSRKAVEIISNIDNEIFISQISFWEISLKYSIGKLELKNVLPDVLPEVAYDSGFDILPLKSSELASCYKLPLEKHKDPFDRIIVWQCLLNEYTLISKDIDIKTYKNHGLKIIW